MTVVTPKRRDKTSRLAAEIYPMKTTKSKKISPQELRQPPAWLESANQAFQQGPLAHLSDEEIGQRCEEIAEKAAKKRKRQTAAR